MIRRALRMSIGAAILGVATAASATPSIWSRARDPAAAERASLLAQADKLLAQRGRFDRTTLETDPDRATRLAMDFLERAGGPTSPSLEVRARYGFVQNELRDYAGCAKTLETVVRNEAPAPLHADAYNTLAVCYAHLGKRGAEIKAYDGALALEPHPLARATLLANRAEAYMGKGDVAAAVRGYRESLAQLETPYDMWRLAPTTYWGLGVALDRSGELDRGLEAIRLARSYDPDDKHLRSPSWFYSPEYDEFWYGALGHWSNARAAMLRAARAEEYGRAVRAWDEYIEHAPADGPWVPLARVRRKQCESERVHAPLPLPPPPPQPRRP